MCDQITPEHILYFVYENANDKEKKIIDINPKLIWHYYFLYFFQNEMPYLHFLLDFQKKYRILYFLVHLQLFYHLKFMLILIMKM